MSRRRRQVSEDYAVQTSAPGWMVTYGDMVTLVLCFFVILFSISSVNARKFELALRSMRDALGLLTGGPKIESELMIDYEPRFAEDETAQRDFLELQQLSRRLRRYLEEAGLKDAIVTHFEERGLVVRLQENVLFDLGKAEIKQEATVILDKVGAVLLRVPNQIRVEGHTDNLPISTPRFPSNWELSTARATAVVKYLIEKSRIEPSRLSAAGYGEYRPIASNDSPEGRQLNRRVDIVIIRRSWSKREPPDLGQGEIIR